VARKEIGEITKIPDHGIFRPTPAWLIAQFPRESPLCRTQSATAKAARLNPPGKNLCKPASEAEILREMNPTQKQFSLSRAASKNNFLSAK
jgi:hypothetical protein